MKAILAIAVICVGGVLSLSEVNEDNLRDQYMYGAGARARRAVCGTKPTITPWRPDPSCYNCVRAGCFVISKRVSIPGRICPRKCCFTSILRGGTSASKSFDSASVKKMASSIVAAFGKRADVSKFKKPSVDLVFLIDDSGSIPAPQFKIAKEGAATLSQTFCPKRFGTVKGTKQVAAVLFSTTAKTIMTFQDSRKGEGYVEETIMNMQQRSGATATADALKHVREKVLGQAGSRLNDPDTATIVFVITDGKCNDECQNLKAEAKKLREAGPGVQVFAFGIGEADCHELESIRSSESGQVFGLPDYNFFEKLADAIKDEVASNPKACQ